MSTLDTIIVGGGPAGLATSRELARAGVAHVVLERGRSVGHTWANLYDSLVLHTGKHLSALPGMPFPAGTPLFPTRPDFLAYLERYADTFRVPLETGADVAAARRENGGWNVRTASGRELRARTLVFATGIVANPHVPSIPGRDRFTGIVRHSVEYRRPDPYRNQSVLVVGAGNSAGEIASELAASGTRVTLAVRSGARVVPRALLGIPIQYFAVALNPLPRAAQQAIQRLIDRLGALVRGVPPLPPPRPGRCSDVPLIGFHLADALRAGTIALKPGIVEFTGTGVRFADGSAGEFDAVVLATGFRAAVGPLGHAIRVDRCGFAERRNRVASADQPGLYFVGHNYDTRGGLRNIAQDARIAAKLMVKELRAAVVRGP